MKSNSVHIPPSPDTRISVVKTELDKSSPSNQNEPHIHKETEIYVNLSGDVVFEVGNKIYPVSRGSVIITRPYEYHRCIYTGDKLHRHYWILIDREAPETIFSDIYGESKIESAHIRLGEESLAELEEALGTLINKKSPKLKNDIAFLKILSILSEKEELPASDLDVPIPSDVLLALKYMDEHIDEPIELSELARVSFVSANTLERHFKEALDLTPTAMLKRKRLIYSTRFLRDGASVSEACERSGFTDYSGYINAFRLFFDMTPLKYKKTLNQ